MDTLSSLLGWTSTNEIRRSSLGVEAVTTDTCTAFFLSSFNVMDSLRGRPPVFSPPVTLNDGWTMQITAGMLAFALHHQLLFALLNTW